MRDESVDLWATDEVHFQQHGSRCRMWVAPEIKDPVLLHAPTRRSVGYFGAVRLRDGRFLFRREEEVSYHDSCSAQLHFSAAFPNKAESLRFAMLPLS